MHHSDAEFGASDLPSGSVHVPPEIPRPGLAPDLRILAVLVLTRAGDTAWAQTTERALAALGVESDSDCPGPLGLVCALTVTKGSIARAESLRLRECQGQRERCTTNTEDFRRN